jgi:glycosyltransferase involved in cell wall biosynthesis
VGFGEGAYLDRTLRENGVPQFHFKNLKRDHNPLAAIFFIFEIKKTVKKEGFDVVQFNSSNSLPGCFGVKLAGKKIKTVFTVHGLSMLDKNCKTFFLLKFVYYLFFKIFLSFADAAVFVSKNNLDEAERMKLTKHGTVIYNGLPVPNLAFLPKNETRDALEKKIGAKLANKFVIGSIGRLSYQKNYEFLIESFPDITNVRNDAVCVIIGDGPKRADCEHLINKLNLSDRIFLVGEISDAPRYLKAFDLFVLPSRYEGLPVTLEECLFAGVTVLASDVGGNEEIVDPENLYRLDDKDDLVKKFAAILKDGGASLNDAERKRMFTSENMSRGYLELFLH